MITKTELVSFKSSGDTDNYKTLDIIWNVYYDDGEVRQYKALEVTNPFYDPRDISIYKSPSGKPNEHFMVDYMLGGTFAACKGYKSTTIKGPDPLDLTMEDIEKEFGRKVRIVKDKHEKL